jgi:hypothetical protein
MILLLNLWRKSIVIFPLVLMAVQGISQANRNIKTIYCKIIEMDSVNQLIDETNLKDKRAFYYDIFHMKALTPKLDTIIIGIVYQIRSDLESFKNYFNYKVDSTYIFDVSFIQPSNSSFVGMRGCNYSTGKYIPKKGQVLKSSCRTIARVIESSKLYPELWDKLRTEY